MSLKPKILVVDDEIEIRRFLKIALEAQDYEVIQAASGNDGIKVAVEQQPDLIILDLGLPDISGLDVLKQLREWNRVPILILSVQDQEHEKINALDNGADDYLTKPFGTGELLARIRLAQRHFFSVQSPTETVFEHGPLRVDLTHRKVLLHGENIKLTKTEYRLLAVLVQHAGKVLTHRYLLNAVWGAEYVEESHYLQVYMAQLRRKLEPNADSPRLFVTESGVGYRLLS